MDTASKLWQRWMAGRSYQNAMGFTDVFPLCVRFKEGDQWPAPTKATRNLPRPVFNYCEKFVRTKRSNILNQTVKMVYSPAEGDIGLSEEQVEAQTIAAKEYTDYAAALWKEIRQDDLNEDCVDDAATLGTGILHYYWDSHATGGRRYPRPGALRGEALDPLTVVFANPQETDVQEQPYIIIATRVPVRDVKRMAREEGLPEEQIQMICADEEHPDTYEASLIEDTDVKKCTLLTMYYRDHGVRYSRSTRTVDLVVGRSLTPGIEDRGKDDEDEEWDDTVDVIDRYPIAVMPWTKRKRSIYGIGEVEGIIPAQRAVNWLMGMNILSVQDTAWPKMIVKPGALRKEITNKPGEIIEDHSMDGNGIRYLQAEGISASASALVDRIGEMMRDVSGVSEVVSGEPFTATMAASAIIALQNQAKQPIENIQKRFYRVIEDVGRIWEEFFKHYYSFPIPMIMEMDNGEEETVLFIGTAFRQMEFDLAVDVGAGSEYSESLAQGTLDKLFDAGQIDLDTYIDLAPKNVMPFREQLRRKLEQLREERAVAGLPEDAVQTAPMQGQNTGRAPLGLQLPQIPEVR